MYIVVCVLLDLVLWLLWTATSTRSFFLLFLFDSFFHISLDVISLVIPTCMRNRHETAALDDFL